MDKNKTITVTSPLLPSLEEFMPYLQDIWDRKWLTNNGHFHQELEKALCEYLKVPYISLFTNGTLPLITALQAMRVTGEVITTPYSFVATTHSLWWNGIKPVFVDIDPATCNLDPAKIEAAITPKTTAIMPVHCYGKPCDVKGIQEVADKYGLKVIYDAAHAFGVELLTPTPSPVGRGVYGSERLTGNPDVYTLLKEYAIDNRKNPTEAENILWQVLRNNQLGTKWRRQHIILDFIVDFICLEKSLIIEVDGEYHNTPEQQKADKLRDQILSEKGYTIIRLTNDEVIGNLDATITKINEQMQNLPPTGGNGGMRGESILNFGDMSTLSFHATKVYNTVEGGALIMHDEQTKKRIDYLKNFGFAGETEVVAPGINSKMDEIRSAYGLLSLKKVDDSIAARKRVAEIYRSELRNIPGIRFFDDMPRVKHNYSYFPIFVEKDFGMTRDELYYKMKGNNVLGRRYFYPLISTFSTYRGLESSDPKNLPIATRIADEVICLPMHDALSENDIQRVIDCIK